MSANHPFSALPKALAHKVTVALGKSSPKALTKASSRLRVFIKDTLQQHARLMKKTKHSSKDAKAKRLAKLSSQAQAAHETLVVVDRSFDQLLTSLIPTSCAPSKNSEQSVRISRKLLAEATDEVSLSAKSLRDSCSLKGKIIDSGHGEKEEITRLEKLARKLNDALKGQAQG